ncbi:DUF3168 domain-containing protein [Paraburkholderia aspalathi]|nr:DUF3168 domain-containing protein [Paraburkholderia aspalathi]
MIEPTLALQTAIRSALLASGNVTALVPANHIRSGSTRPDSLPCVILSGVSTQNLGHASGGQYLARCLIDLHVWAIDDGHDTAWQIGFAVCNALRDAPEAADFGIDDWSVPTVRWMRDPDPDKSYCHGVISLEAVVRWSI